MAKKVLIVDDDPLIRLGLEKLIAKEGYAPICVGTGKAALSKIEEEADISLVLLDVKLPDSYDGLSLLEIIKKSRPEITVIMISGQTEIRGAVEAMKLGALDYLEKPIDFDRLKSVLANVAALWHDESSAKVDDSPFAALQCKSKKMRQAIDLMRRLAVKSDITILITGESGTGKNFLCQKLHEMSPRRDYPYVQIGCANIPEHLIESELFGYEKGAFTDAKNSKKGLVEIAEGGTILLDELGEMPYAFQAKILRLLEEKCFRRIGALQDTYTDVRILAATNKDLHQLVQEKKFRLDLYYRLNTATIELPPLRERFEDIPQLVNTFLKHFAKKYDSPVKSMTEDAMLTLQQYAWPGNVRQLKNLIEKLVVLSEQDKIGNDEICANLLIQQQANRELPSVSPLSPAAPAAPGVGETVALDAYEGLSLEAMERKHIKTALKLSGGNQRKAAKLLCISRDTLRYRLKKLNIEE
ncbi:MAG: sigma-54 dependent transcriptional regulator [Thermodesulfobacteriota bacterium]